MIVLDNAIVSDEVADTHFLCNLNQCKGQCCVKGDRGAPLENKEIFQLHKIFPKMTPFLTPIGISTIKDKGIYIKHSDGVMTTPLIDNQECAYSVTDARGRVQCAFEKAYKKGVCDFQKPTSCHLYPIRVTSYQGYYAVNYHQAKICHSGCNLGQQFKIHLYRFAKKGLIRKFGESWYKALVKEIEKRETARKD